MPVAHFVITGEAMTEIARDMLLSDLPGQAYRIVADGLIGDGAIEAALSVLKGTHDLTGDSTNGLELVEAEDNEALQGFKENFRYIYAGRHRHQGAWRRPVGCVVQFNADDAAYATDRAPETDKHRWGRARTEYYCAPGETVSNEPLERPEASRAYIIWEPCGEMPHWMKPNITPQEALDEAFAAGRPFDERLAGKSQAQLDREDDRERQKVERQRRVEREKDEAERQRLFDEQVIQIGEKVRAQAGDDTFVLELKDGRKLTVPRAPFVRWSLRTHLGTSMPDWDNVAPSGMKMQMDNPDHTDWVLGSGLALHEAYADDINEAVWDAAFKFQEEAREAKEQKYPSIMAAIELLNDTIHKAATVVDAGERTGTVGVDIAVFPDSQGERAKQLDGIVGAIVEKGGKIAHFAIVSKGLGVTVMRHPKACELFKNGTRVNLNPKTGRIVILGD